MALNGIDVSSWQAGIDLAAVPSDFVIVKATEGTTYVSQPCDAQVTAASAAGRLVGVYHFATGNSSGLAEADHFLKNCAGYIGRAILVLDWETNAVNKGPGYALAFLNRVLEKTGVRPLIYMSASIIGAHDWSKVVAANFGLWVAAYGPNVPTGYRDVPAPAVKYWAAPAIFQYGSNGQLPGYSGSLDVNRFYGDHADWLAYAAPNGVSEQPNPPDGAAPNPQPNPAPVLPTPNGTYTVVAGDNLSSIAAANGTTWQAIASANGIANPNLIYPGQLLMIPSTKPAAPSQRTYTVKPGDSLSSIGAAHGVSWNSIYEANRSVIGGNPNLIRPGQVLVIP